MAKVTASPNLLAIEEGKRGASTVTYEKDERQTIWARLNFGTWNQLELHRLTNSGDVAQRRGTFPVSALNDTLNAGLMRSGDVAEVAVFEEFQGGDHDPRILATASIAALLKRPGPSPLISDHNRSTGGTWHSRQVATTVPTSLVLVGATQKPITFDADGLPIFSDLEGGITSPTSHATSHRFELTPLFAGQHYEFITLVVDQSGNWQVFTEPFATLRREVTIEIPGIHIYNDGDPMGHGSGEFWIDLKQGGKPVETFHIHEMDIDDWSETDRFYPFAFVYAGQPESVTVDNFQFTLFSRGLEHDGIFEQHEHAWSDDNVIIGIPHGKNSERVVNKTFNFKCPAVTSGDDFSYGVDVRYSIHYAP